MCCTQFPSKQSECDFLLKYCMSYEQWVSLMKQGSYHSRVYSQCYAGFMYCSIFRLSAWFFSCNVVCFPSFLIKLPLRTLSSTFFPRIHHHSAHFTQSTQTLFANKFANTDFFTKGSDLFG